MVKAVNIKTGVETTFTEKEWNKVQSNPILNKAFKAEIKAKVPSEVESIEGKEKASKKSTNKTKN